MTRRIIDHCMVALDNLQDSEITPFLQKVDGDIPYLKIGLEMFLHGGRPLVEEILEKYSFKIFLDLKLHDIPNTVKGAIKSLNGLSLDFLTIHLTGGEKMVAAAMEECQRSLPQTKLLGVSYLTSLEGRDFKTMWNYDEDQVGSAFDRLFTMAARLKLPGIVLSAHELERAKKFEQEFGHQFSKVTPGIRFADEIEGNVTQDQKRVQTPEEALANGSNYLVIGRSLNQASDLSARINQLKQSI